MKRICSLTLFCIITFSGSFTAAQDKQEATGNVVVPQTNKDGVKSEIVGQEKILRGYKTWSLFLVCKDWKTKGYARVLYEQFEKFGDAIGDANLAVWFWKTSMATASTDLDHNVDVARAQKYCKQYHLDPSAGPYVVVVNTYPDDSDAELRFALFTFGSDPESIGRVLDGLAGELLKGKYSQDTGTDTNQAAVAWWVPLLEGVQRCMGKFGCAWDFKLEAGPASTELKPCKG
jgi:hypothetical protein